MPLIKSFRELNVYQAAREATETQSWLDDCLDCGYISAGDFKQMDAAWQSIGAMLNKMIMRADDFCGTQKE